MELMAVDITQQQVEYPWTKETILYLIQEIRGNPTLYDRKNANFKDRKVRTATYTEIAENIQTKYAARCTRQDVLEKWTDMKCNFFIEKKKVETTLRSILKRIPEIKLWNCVVLVFVCNHILICFSG